MHYGSFEVDSLICITLLDTKEQQVVKIHKTLKSVTAETAKPAKQMKAKNNVYPSITAILTSPGNMVNDNGTEQGNAEQQSYTNDINVLSDLLKESNSLYEKEKNQVENAQEPLKNRRKRKKKQAIENVAEQSAENATKEGSKSPVESTDAPIPGYDRYTDTVIIVKEEPIDMDYGVSQSDTNTAQASQDGRMSREPSAHETEMPDTNEDSQYSNEKEIDGNVVADVNSEYPPEDTPIPDSTNIDTVTDRSNDANGRDNVDPNEDLFTQFLAGQSDQNKASEMSHQKHSEWLYQLAKKSLLDSGNNSGSDSGSSDNVQSTARTRYGMPRERGRQEPDPQGRSWFEMIKSNASKYQAALMRSGNKGKPKPSTKDSFEQLKNLLGERKNQKESVIDKAGQGSVNRSEDINYSNGSEDNFESKEGSADGVSESEKSMSRSISPAPIVKIEVDEQVPINYDQSLNEGRTEHETPTSSVSSADPKAQGKLVSRYPALFNQLQTKRDTTPNPNVEQSDSLLNRLPFISFQELFSQPGQSAVKDHAKVTSETSKQPFLEKALKKDQSKTGNAKKGRTVWNWKKRRVRPKDEHGNIIDYLPAGAPVPWQMTSKKRQKLDEEDDDDTDWTPSSEKKAKFKGSLKSPGKRLSTRLSAGDSQKKDFSGINVSDAEEEFEEDEPIGEGSDAAQEENIELISAYCRYQCGRRFETFGDLAEHEHECEGKVSGSIDTQDDEAQSEGALEEGDEINEGIYQSELIPIDTTDGFEQAEGSGQADVTVPVEGSEQVDATGPMEGSEQGDVTGPVEGSGQTGGHKCSICGLDFNQQYRWQYHMVKVHGISVTTDHLFR